MKCESCRKAEVLDTRWDKIRLWIFKHLFRTDYEDLRSSSFTQGISEGYQIGFKSGQEVELKYREYAKNSRSKHGESSD